MALEAATSKSGGLAEISDKQHLADKPYTYHYENTITCNTTWSTGNEAEDSQAPEEGTQHP